MRNLIVVIWCLILGQVVGYIGSALTSGTYDPTTTTIVSLICAVFIMLIGYIAVPDHKNAQKK